MPARSRPGARSDNRVRDLDAYIDQLVAGAPSVPHGPRRRAFHRILACVGEADPRDVLSWTREIASLFSADVTVIHATRPPPSASIYPAAGPLGLGATAAPIPLPDPSVARERSERILRDARSRLLDDVPEVALLHREGHAGDEIVHAARELASDLIVLGHHDGGALDRLLVGSTADHVKDHTHADVLIVRTPASAGPLVVGVDGSGASRQAAAIADEIARRWSTSIHLLHVVPSRWHTAVDEGVAEELRANLEAQGATTPIEGVEMDLRAGEPRAELRLAASRLRASLVVVGARGTSGLRSLMPGSVSNALAHECPASVLLVRDHDKTS